MATASQRIRELLPNLPDVKAAKTNTRTHSEGIEEAKRRAKAQEDAACAQAAASIVAALVIIVVAIVVATVTSGVSKGDVDAAAIDLASAYQDEGGSALRRCLDAANERYRSRIKSIPKTVTSLERQQAVLQYQAAWLAEKSGCEGWASV